MSIRKPTKEQIKKEADALAKMKPTIRQFSAFGDNHHAAIDAQVEVLTRNLSADQIYDEDWPESVQSAAMEARDWMDGEYEEDSIADSWKELVR